MLALLVSLSCFAPDTFAQQAVLPLQGVGLSASSLSNGQVTPPAFSRFHAATGVQDDVLVGRNAPGPYQLSWKNVRAGSEVVVRSGALLSPVTDYTFDAAAGVLSFTSALSAGELVRVTYLCDTPNAVPNAAALAMPLQWDLWQSGQTRLRVASLFHSNAGSVAASSAPPDGYTALQFLGNTRLLAGSRLTSGLFVDLQGGDWLRRGGLTLGERTRLGLGEFGFSYARAGTLFAQQGAEGLTTGREILEATGKLTLLRALTLSLDAKQTTQLLPPTPTGAGDLSGSGDTRGDTTRELGGDLTLALAHGKLEASHTQTTLSSLSGGGTDSTHDTASLTANLVKGTEATVGYDASTTATSGAANYQPGHSTDTQTTRIGIKSSPNTAVTVTGSFQNRLDSTGAADTQQIAVEATPFTQLRAIKLKAEMQDSYQKEGANRSRAALLQLPPLAPFRLQLSGGVRQNSTPGERSLVGLIDASAQPHRYLQISGAIRLRDATQASGAADPADVDTYDLKLALSPWKQLRLTGSVTQNPEATDSSVKRLLQRNIGLEADLGLFSMHGKIGLEENYPTAQTSDTTDLGFDLRITRWDTLTTGFQAHNLFTNLLVGDNTYTLGFTHHLGSAFDLTLSGALTTHDINGRLDAGQNEVKAQAKVGLHF